MHNTAKDRFEKKLIRFIRELDKNFNDYRSLLSSFDAYQKNRDDLYKKYGFTDEEWEKACRLIRSRSWAGKRIEQKKFLRDKRHDVYRSDIADNPNGEAEIKAEDDWVADVFDTNDYDEKDMTR